ncbi:MAG TPA: CHAT domain-containing tetratricopeptide repeat protein [Pirellulales bacterium]|jgi:CHAT domain-containing protein|nr:CHAT domain-containing tetratricopeptide repeat protein [Pirellulales bacterium]
MRAVRLLLPVCLALSASAVNAADTPGKPASLLAQSQEQFEQGDLGAAYRLARQSEKASRSRQPLSEWELLAKICCRSGMLKEATAYAQRYLEVSTRLTGSGAARLADAQQQVAMSVADAYAMLGQREPAARWYRRALAIPHGKRREEWNWEPEVKLRLADVIELPAAEAKVLYEQVAQATSGRLRKESEDLDADQRARTTAACVQASIALGRTKPAMAALESLLAKQTDARERGETTLRLVELRGMSAADTDELAAIQELADEIDSEKASMAEAQLLERIALLQDQQPRDKTQDNAERAAQRRALLEESARAWQQVYKSAHSIAARVSALEHWHDLLVRQGQWQQARDTAENLLEVRKRTLMPLDPAVFRAETALGICSAKCARYDEAKQHLGRALKFWERFEPRGIGELHETLQNLAEIAREQGEYELALTYLQQSEAAIEGWPKAPFARIGCRISRANVLSAQGEYQGAIHEYDSAVNEAAADEPELQRLRALALLGRAAVYKTQSRFDGAVEDAQAALGIYDEYPAIRQLDDLGCLAMLASLYLARYESQNAARLQPADLDKARGYLDQIDQRSGGLDKLPTSERCQVLHVRGLVSFRQAQAHFRPQADRDLAAARPACAQAEECWTEVAALAREGQLPSMQMRSEAFLADAKLLEFDFLVEDQSQSRDLLKQAEECAGNAIQLAQRLQAFPGLHYRALLSRAKIYRRQARKLETGEAEQARAVQAAIEDLKSAVLVVEQPRTASLGADPERAEFFSQFIEAYELLVTLFVEAGDFESALAYSQISRNRTYIEQVKVPSNELRAELTETHQHELDALNRAVEKYDALRKEIRQRSNSPMTPAQLSSYEDKWVRPLIDAQRDCDRLANKVRQLSPSYQNLLRRGLSIDDWAPARDRVLGAASVLLVYHIGPSASQLFVVAPSRQVSCFHLQVTRDAASELVCAEGPLDSLGSSDLVMRYLTRRGVRRNERGTESTPQPAAAGRPFTSAQALRFAQIVLPEEVRSIIRGANARSVTVVADGALHRLPLEALPTSETAYLLDDTDFPPICYAPSVMVMSALCERSSEVPSGAPSLLTVGDPVASDSGDGAKLARLDWSQAECEHWASQFEKVGGVERLYHEQATRSSLRQHVAGKRFVHCAVHGLVDERHDTIFAGALVLSPDASVPDDGKLYLQDVYGLDLNRCELTILSACASNVGAQRKLEAGSSLTRAFLSAGSRRVVSSLWQVQDESTAELMSRFADAIAGALVEGKQPNYAEALQQARRHVRQKRQWEEPYHWAPFVLIGPAS